MKKILSSLAIISISLFGATNELLVPKTDDSIVDIGYNQPKSTYEVTVPKEWTDYTALVRDVDNNIYSKERVLSEKYDCEIDYLGRENCTVQAVDCNANLEQSDGVSELINKTQYINKIKISVPRNQSAQPNSLNGDYRLAPNIGAVDGSMFSIQYDSSFSNSLPLVSTMMSEGFIKDGKFTIKAFNFGSGFGQLYFNQTPSRTKTLIAGGSSVGNGYIHSPDAHYAIVEMQWDTPPTRLTFGCDDFCLVGKPDNPEFGFWNWGCPETFIDADGIKSASGQCKKDYSYYKYKCDSDTNTYDRPWIGPVINSGGDCNGNCGDYGCICNSPTPPKNNCVRDNFVCPFDSNQLCTITTDDKSSVNNVIDGYIYENGSATTYNSSIEIEKECSNGLIWNKEKDICQDEVEYTCLNNKFIYNKETKECTAPIECEGILLEDGTCQIDANVKCQEGYTYQKSKGRCESLPVCDRGNYNTLTDMCEDEISCPIDFTYNKLNERCESPFEQKNMTCPQVTDIFVDSLPSYCITKPILTDPIYTGVWSDAWWGCSNCWSGDWLSASTGNNYPGLYYKLLNATIVSGGTQLPILSGRTMKGDNKKAFYINMNGGPTLTINPNDTFTQSGSGFTNNTTGQSISAGGKPVIYIRASISCTQWETVPASKDFPEHQKCVDVSSNYASCPSGYLKGEKNGNVVCYKEPICPNGYTLSADKMQCIKTVTCETGYTPNYETNKCIKNSSSSDIKVDLNGGIYYSYAVCNNNFILDKNFGVCVFDATCNYTGQLDITNDRCVLKAEFSCPETKIASCETGYYYNSDENKCIKTPSCETGVWDYINKICVESPVCENGYIMNFTSGYCEKQIETQAYNCLTNETLINGELKDVCRIVKEGSSCPVGYTESLNTNYCERDISCPSTYPNIDYKNNQCYKL